MSLKLHTENIGGNLHQASTIINRWGWAEYLIHLDCVTGSNTIAVFRMPAEKVHEIRQNSQSYCADPSHDDYVGPIDRFSAFYTGGGETAVAGEINQKLFAPSTSAPVPTLTVAPLPVPDIAPGATTDVAPVPPRPQARKKAVCKEPGPAPVEQSTVPAHEPAASASQEVDTSNLPSWAQ